MLLRNTDVVGRCLTIPAESLQMESKMTELGELKIKLKNIEKAFLSDRGKKPTQKDIEDFSPEIRELYKRYSKLKNCKNSCVNLEKESKESEVCNKANVWGLHLNKNTNEATKCNQSKNAKVQQSSFSASCSRKLRESAHSMRLNEKLALRKKQTEVENETNDSTINFIKPKFKISKSVYEAPKATPVNLFHVNDLQPPINDDEPVESSFCASQSDTDEVKMFCDKIRLDECLAVEFPQVSSTSESMLSPKDTIPQCSDVEVQKIDDKKCKRNRDNDSHPQPVISKKLKLDDLELSSNTSIKPNRKKTAASENYVRINLKKRVYCRGKKKFNYKRYKFNKWKELQHTKKPFKSVRLNKKIDEQSSDSDESAFDTYLEKAQCEKETNLVTSQTSSQGETVAVERTIYATVEPFCDESEIHQGVIEGKAKKLLKVFGYDSFRSGQIEAILRVLAGLPALVIQPTGAGKSLCYLLPALMYAKRSSCITLVISPLVSLMEDQLTNVPSCLKAACLHTNMTDRQREKIRSEISIGNVELLFISPESLVGGAGSAFGCLPPTMPPVAFVCIDEIHCVSTWSHNFRPSYLRLCRVIREVLGVKCILGLTATASAVTLNDVAHHIGMNEGSTDCVIKATEVPSNLRLTVSRDHGEKALLDLLQSEAFSDCDSIIIYCIRRQITERLATLIRTFFQEKYHQGEDQWGAEPYHAGLTAARRRTVQKQFMQGKLRVMVATVAFGMGINKMDVRAVIHYDLPKSIESYVQEIGRAGRDGQQAYCHVFLDTKGEDRQELRRHIYSDTVDRCTVRKFIEIVFSSSIHRNLNNPFEEDSDAAGYEEAFSIEGAINKLDLKQEGIETLLCYLELHPSRPIQLLNCTYGMCKIYCYSETTRLNDLAAKCSAVALALKMKRFRENDDRRLKQSNMVEFPMVKVSNILGCGVVSLRRELKKLQWEEIPISAGGMKYQKTGVVVECSDLCFHLKVNQHLTNDEIDNYIEYLHKRIVTKEKLELEQLQQIYDTMNRFSFSKFWLCEGDEVTVKSEGLRTAIDSYFKGKMADESLSSPTELIVPLREEDVECVLSNVRQLLAIYHEQRFTGRAVARIFHGISSPNFPAETWGRVRQFWRRHLAFDFNQLCQLANEQILKRK